MILLYKVGSTKDELSNKDNVVQIDMGDEHAL